MNNLERTMRLGAGVAALAVAALVGSPAMAWGAKGHQYVGNLATELLHANAAAKVNTILGHDLGHAAVWADCVRDVKKQSNGTFKWVKNNTFTPKACNVFDTPAGRARMEDYAKRNWTNCKYAGAFQKCNLAFHFTDVAIQHNDYQDTYHGTGNADLVHALEAAILKLQDKPVPAPFHFKDKKEALFLIAHFVGDLHQPLHAGAVYLEADGDLINPDATPGDDHDAETVGGNWLYLDASQDDNLHHDWDTIASSLGVFPDDPVIAAAKAVPITSGSFSSRPRVWATESVLAAQGAYANLTFTGLSQRAWKVNFTDRDTYVDNQRQVQLAQMTKAGARLAEILNGIWP